jgi:hypothetical protein
MSLQVLARRDSKGAYDFTRTDKVVHDTATGKVYAVVDEWCDINGETYRPAVYAVPAYAVSKVVADVRDGDLFTQDATDEGEVDSIGVVNRKGKWVWCPKVAQPGSRKFAAIKRA